MKIRVKFFETTEYEAVIEVPESYPKDVETWLDADNDCAPVLFESPNPDETISEVDGEDWFQRINNQIPKWFEVCFASATERELQELEPVPDETPIGPTAMAFLNTQTGEMLLPTAETS